MAICKNCGHQLIFENGRYLHPDTNEDLQYTDNPIVHGLRGCWCGCEKPERARVKRKVLPEWL